jgi:ribonuclease HII
MRYPNFSEEKKLWKQGFCFVAGLDEAGRGPLAGPVVAAAVNFKFEILNFKSILNDPIFKKIKDSKQLSANQREEIYKVITNHPNISWGVGIVGEKIIDKINILQATKLAMTRAITSLRERSSKQSQGPGLLRRLLPPRNDELARIDYLLIDGNFTLNEAAFARGFGVPRQKSIIKGDQKVFSISAASIIAKVTRDRIMQKFHKKYPQYRFDKHKGYGTEFHINKIKEFGLCPIHRRTFRIK